MDLPSGKMPSHHRMKARGCAEVGVPRPDPEAGGTHEAAERAERHPIWAGSAAGGEFPAWRVVLGQERSFSPAFFDFGFQNGAKECIV